MLFSMPASLALGFLYLYFSKVHPNSPNNKGGTLPLSIRPQLHIHSEKLCSDILLCSDVCSLASAPVLWCTCWSLSGGQECLGVVTVVSVVSGCGIE